MIGFRSLVDLAGTVAGAWIFPVANAPAAVETAPVEPECEHEPGLTYSYVDFDGVRKVRWVCTKCPFTSVEPVTLTGAS